MENLDKKQKDKFVYKDGEIKFVNPKKKKKVKEEQILSFTQFLEEKQQNKFVTFNPETMRWITIHDRDDQLQHILIRKKDGTILGGMGGTETGNKIGDVFDEIKNEKDEKKVIEKFKETAVQGNAVNELCDISKLNLSPEILQSVKKYTGSSYRDINSLLRNPEYKNKISSESVKSYEKDIENISSTLQNYKTPKPIITYRGMSSKIMKSLEKNMKVGNIWKDDGFVSTSSSYDVANIFTNISSGGYILEVHIPKGSHALSIDSISNFSGKEFEVLLNKGSEFLIQEVNHDKHIITVELQNKD